MAVTQWPKHGEVLDIDGSKMTDSIKQKLEEVGSTPYNANAKPTLPDELLYDDIGLPIWNEIIFTPEFYQTHDEIAIFDKHGAEVAMQVPSDITMVDLGAGDTRKVEHLLAAFERSKKTATYLALDISKASLEHNVGYLEEKYADLESTVSCSGLWGTFEDGLRWVQAIKGPRLFLSLGSVLCNDPWAEALRKVKNWAAILRPDDMLLVGMDAHLTTTNKDKIWAAYHSRDDLFRKFFLNGFRHANQLVGEQWFRQEDWDFEAELENPTRHRFYFRAKHDFRLGSQGRVVRKGEEFDWFDSHKYSQSDVETMLDKAGLTITNMWRAPNSEFRQYLVRLKDISDQRGDGDSAISNGQ